MQDEYAADPAKPAAATNSQTNHDTVDVLPSDLDPSAVSEPYVFPNNSRRRIPAVLYAVLGAICIAARFIIRGDNAIINDALINNGVLVAGIVLLGISAYHAQAGWHLAFDEEQALQAAARDVGFALGHASAQLSWRGLRSRPTWRVLLYSNEPEPKQRGLVLVDGINGEIVARFVESNPEDWTALNRKAHSHNNSPDNSSD